MPSPDPAKRREQMRRWYLKNRERILSAQKTPEGRARLREAQARFRKKHGWRAREDQDKHRERSRAYRRANRAKSRALQRAYYERNRDQILAKKRARREEAKSRRPPRVLVGHAASRAKNNALKMTWPYRAKRKLGRHAHLLPELVALYEFTCKQKWRHRNEH